VVVNPESKTIAANVKQTAPQIVPLRAPQRGRVTRKRR
jgi:hypothetical protein